MTDLSNDATSNLSNGASGQSSTDAGETSSFGGSTTGQSSSYSGSMGGQSSSFAADQFGTTSSTAGRAGASGPSTKAEDFALNTTRELENRAYQARDWAMTQTDTVRTQVLDKPFVSVGTAFAAGIVFGLLLRR